MNPAGRKRPCPAEHSWKSEDISGEAAYVVDMSFFLFLDHLQGLVEVCYILLFPNRRLAAQSA